MFKGMYIWAAIWISAICFAVNSGCDPEFLTNGFDWSANTSGARPVSAEGVQSVEGHQSAEPRRQDSIVVGSFNIQVFGRAKMGNSDVVRVLVDIARQFDVLAIQELRSTDQNIVPNFVKLLNSDGSSFNYIVGPRQGYTISKEQYVYIYNTRTLRLLGQPYVAEDTAGVMHRSPLVAQFQCVGLPPEQAFSFTLLNIHTDPDEVRREIPQLREIVGGVFSNHPGEDDFIVLGDLNAPPRFFEGYPWLQNQIALIPDDWTTNTRGSRNLDNIVIDAWRTAEFQNQAGVLNLMHEYQLTRDQALSVSDHMPIWAVFSAAEARVENVSGVDKDWR